MRPKYSKLTVKAMKAARESLKTLQDDLDRRAAALAKMGQHSASEGCRDLFWDLGVALDAIESMLHPDKAEPKN